MKVDKCDGNEFEIVTCASNGGDATHECITRFQPTDDQIKAAVIKMGDEVQYGDSDEDGTLTYTYLIGDRAQLIVMTRES